MFPVPNQDIERAVAWRLDRAKKNKTIRDEEAYAVRIRKRFERDPEDLRKCLERMEDEATRAAEEPKRRMVPEGNRDLEGPAFSHFDADGRPVQYTGNADRARAKDFHDPRPKQEGKLPPPRLVKTRKDREDWRALRTEQIGARTYCELDAWLQRQRPGAFAKLRVLEQQRPEALREISTKVGVALLEGDARKGPRSLVKRYSPELFLNLIPVQAELRQRTAIAIARAYEERKAGARS